MRSLELLAVKMDSEHMVLDKYWSNCRSNTHPLHWWDGEPVYWLIWVIQ